MRSRSFEAEHLRPEGAPRGRAVLLHGIMSGPSAMRPLARRFRARGHEVLVVGYPSTTMDLEAIADGVRGLVRGFDRGDGVPLGFATHSMGGLVVRVMLGAERPASLGNVAMIAPPNAGSEVADLLKDVPVYGRLYGPAGRRLASDMAADLPVPDCPVGVVAGTVSLQLAGWILFDGPNDGRVAVARAGLGPDVPVRLVASSHPFIARHPEAMRQAIAFVEDGAFASPGPGFLSRFRPFGRDAGGAGRGSLPGA